MAHNNPRLTVLISNAKEYALDLARSLVLKKYSFMELAPDQVAVHSHFIYTESPFLYHSMNALKDYICLAVDDIVVKVAQVLHCEALGHEKGVEDELLHLVLAASILVSVN